MSDTKILGPKEGRRMIAPRVLAAACPLLTAGPLACASTGPPRVWDEFPATYANFERHFDARSQDLDPIKGIWGTRDTRTALADSFIIVRDTSYAGYDFVGVRSSARQRQKLPFTVERLDPSDPRAGEPVSRPPPSTAQDRGELFVALQRSASDDRAYEYIDVALLRGENCKDKPCEGVYFIAADGKLHRQRFAGEDHSSGCGWLRRYPS
jgi:hypothetical protein